MTTLPQTTPMRAPRPSNGHLAVPMPMPAMHAGAAMSGADAWRIVRANLWLILGTLFASAVVGYLANMWLLAKHARYTATGLLSVRAMAELPRDVFNPPADPNPATLEIEQQTTTKRLMHESLLSAILTKDGSPIRDTEWFKQFITYKNGQQIIDAQAAKQDLLEHMDVIPQPTSRLIEVKMTYSVPKDCKTIIQEICDQYINDEKSRQTAVLSDRFITLTTLADNDETKLNGLNKTLQQLGFDLGRAGIMLNGSSIQIYDLGSLRAEEYKALEILNEYQGKLDTFRQQLTLGSSPEISSAMKSDSKVQFLESAQLQWMIEADMQKGRGPNSQSYQMAQQRLELYAKQLEDIREALKAETVRNAETLYSNIIESTKKTLEQIHKQIDKTKDDIAASSSKEREYEIRTKEWNELTIHHEKVKEEQNKISTLISSGKWNTVDWAQTPNLPDHPSFPHLIYVMGMAMALGLGLSLGIAFLREMTDTSVRSPRDIARVGQMTLLGMIPNESDDPQLSGARLPLAIFEAPHSMVAEQFRQVRTRLQHAASLDTTRSILVTGCSPEDGKTTVASNIAAGLALNGRRILLVDANFRRPNLHSVYAVSNDVGFGDVLNSPDTFPDCVRATEVPNLSVMPTGNCPSNPTELLESQLLIDFIERALEEYDHVIFDSGPLLMVSDSIALAPRVDGVITVVRARGNSRGLLQRVRDELRRLKAEHLGVVLNAVRVQGGGYYGPMIKSHYAYQNR